MLCCPLTPLYLCPFRLFSRLLSPLWQIVWVTSEPINYLADQASNSAAMVPENGFDAVPTPMFVNCPNIGQVGAVNVDKISSFQTDIDLSDESNTDNVIIGSDASLIMTPEREIAFVTDDGIQVGSTLTNMMGAYEYNVPSADIPQGTKYIDVVYDGNVLRTVNVVGGDASSGAVRGTPVFFGSILSLALLGLISDVLLE